MVEYDKVVVDTSVVIEGLLTRILSEGKVKVKELIVPEAVLAELESQANKNRETGFLGLEELEKLQEENLDISFKGNRPKEFEVKYAYSGEVDSLIRDLAFRENAVLFTADVVQAKAARAKGVKVYLYRFEKDESLPLICEYLGEYTLEVRLVEGESVKVREGFPWHNKLKTLKRKKQSYEEIKFLVKDLYEKSHRLDSCFLEVDKKNYSIFQISNYRVIVTRPPLSSKLDVRVVKKPVSISLSEFNLSKKQIFNVSKASNVFILGSTGSGKSTFLKSLLTWFSKKHRVSIVQRYNDLSFEVGSVYNLSHSSMGEIKELLYLNKPDIIGLDLNDEKVSFNNVKTIYTFNLEVKELLDGLALKYKDVIIVMKDGFVEVIYSVVKEENSWNVVEL